MCYDITPFPSLLLLCPSQQHLLPTVQLTGATVTDIPIYYPLSISISCIFQPWPTLYCNLHTNTVFIHSLITRTEVEERKMGGKGRKERELGAWMRWTQRFLVPDGIYEGIGILPWIVTLKWKFILLSCSKFWFWCNCAMRLVVPNYLTGTMLENFTWWFDVFLSSRVDWSRYYLQNVLAVSVDSNYR